MIVFEMVRYHNRNYPPNIKISIEEVAGHFDVVTIKPVMDYSLHTEYSYGKRKFTNVYLEALDEIITSHKGGIPQLWKNELWAKEFANFILRATEKLVPPKVIEIHPPFDDYTDNISEFIRRYKVFEEIIKSRYPTTDIYIENRCGSIYCGGKFIISVLNQMVELCDRISKENLSLKIAFDVPQFYTAHNVTIGKKHLIIDLLNELRIIRKYIGGVHLWGKKFSENGRKIAHYGDLNSYFNNDIQLKREFLFSLAELFDDGICRKLVLEVNSSDNDLLSIINDLNEVGFKYI